MTDSSERVVVTFGDVDLSDVCLVVGNTDFNVHKMVLASRSSYFKALFFGDFKEKNEKRITIEEEDPVMFQRMLEIMYEGRCANEDFFKCIYLTVDVFSEVAVPLWELLDRRDVQIRWKYFENSLNRYSCTKYTPLFACKSSTDPSSRASTCSHCAFRKLFAMQNGIKMDVSAFDSSSTQTAVMLARKKKIQVDAEVLTEFIESVMRLGVQ